MNAHPLPRWRNADSEALDAEIRVRRVLAGRGSISDLTEVEQVDLARAWIRRRRSRHECGPGVYAFADTYGVTRGRAQTLLYRAAGRNAHGRPATHERQAA